MRATASLSYLDKDYSLTKGERNIKQEGNFTNMKDMKNWAATETTQKTKRSPLMSS